MEPDIGADLVVPRPAANMGRARCTHNPMLHGHGQATDQLAQGEVMAPTRRYDNTAAAPSQRILQQRLPAEEVGHPRTARMEYAIEVKKQ